MTQTIQRAPARRFWAGLTGALALLAAAGAPAADAEGNYAVWGVGQASCYQFGKAYAAGELDTFKAYLAGFLTAYNVVTEGVYQATGQRTLPENLAELDALCAKNPMDSFERAIQALIAKGYEEQRKAHAGAAWGRAAPAQ